MDNKLVYIILIFLIIFYILFYSYDIYSNNLTNPKTNLKTNLKTNIPSKSEITQQEVISKQLEHHMKKDKNGFYIENKILSGQLQLPPVEYYTPDNKRFIRYINPHNVNKLKKMSHNTDIIHKKFIKDKIKHPKDLYKLKHNCSQKAFRRCKVPQIHSPRCYLNECELSSYKQCTNNVGSQNSCNCRSKDLCNHKEQVLERCYRQKYKECKRNL